MPTDIYFSQDIQDESNRIHTEKAVKKLKLKESFHKDSQVSVQRKMPQKQSLNVQSQNTADMDFATNPSKSPELIAKLQNQSLNSLSNQDVIDE